jgi:hypothetical protein
MKQLRTISEEDQAALIAIWQRCADEAIECSHDDGISDRMRKVCIKLAKDYQELIAALREEFGQGQVRH